MLVKRHYWKKRHLVQPQRNRGLCLQLLCWVQEHVSSVGDCALHTNTSIICVYLWREWWWIPSHRIIFSFSPLLSKMSCISNCCSSLKPWALIYLFSSKITNVVKQWLCRIFFSKSADSVSKAPNQECSSNPSIHSGVLQFCWWRCLFPLLFF